VILEEVSVANKDPPRGVSKTAASALSQRKTDTPYRSGIDMVARRCRPPVSADHRKGKIIGLGTRGGRPIAKLLNPRKRNCAIYRKLDSRVHPQALMLRKNLMPKGQRVLGLGAAHDNSKQTC